MAATRDDLHRLADALPDRLVGELVDLVRIFERQLADGDAEEVTDPEEVEIVRQALDDDPDEPEYNLDQAKAYLRELLRSHRRK